MLEKLQQPSLISSLAEAKLKGPHVTDAVVVTVPIQGMLDVSQVYQVLWLPWASQASQQATGVSLPLDSDDVLDILESSPNPVVEHPHLQEATTPPVAHHTPMFAVKSLQVLDIIKE
ncbi:hypothetical protein FB451DRAFT_1201823 [Mycena latifolia]|nr:hypothetical protein FB451DRAFT_1201823 [Mycena latifolia]